MRVTIKFDSATTSQVRALSAALSKVLGDNHLTLGVEGPERWHGETPHLTPNQFADVFGELVKVDGLTIGSIATNALRNNLCTTPARLVGAG